MAQGGMLDRLRRGGRIAEPLRDLERRLGVRFRDPGLLERALTHSSYANERGLPHDYERLEFLGDSVLGLLAAQWLFAEYPDLPEGRLTAMKSRLVSRPALAAHAGRLELGAALKLGVGEERTGGRAKSSLLAAALEAVLGAVYLDRGLDAARRLAEELFDHTREEGDELALDDPKMRLQERAQARGGELPVYRLVAESGPDHRKRFRVECTLDGLSGQGEGRSKKIAEQRAATALLARLP